MGRISFLFILGLFLSGNAYSKGAAVQDSAFFLYGGVNFHFTNTVADQVTGANYTKRMINPLIGVAGLGVRAFNFLYLGVRYEYWNTSREFTLSGVQRMDTVNYQTIGGELGIWRGNPRFFWIASAGYFHSLVLNVDSSRAGTSSSYTRATKPATYQARMTLGVKLNNRFALRFEGGYRHANLGNLTSSGTPLLTNGENLDLSGPFAGIGLGLHF